jgi:hypothetical protein
MGISGKETLWSQYARGTKLGVGVVVKAFRHVWPLIVSLWSSKATCLPARDVALQEQVRT